MNRIKRRLLRILTLSLFIIVLFVLRFFLIQFFWVSGNSMLPVLNDGDIVIVNKFLFPVKFSFLKNELRYGTPEIKRLDLIMFENEKGELLIKRIVGLNGEYYAYDWDQIIIDVNPLVVPKKFRGKGPKKPEVKFVVPSPDTAFLPIEITGRIPPGYYLLLGDNRANSTDSRHFGLIPESSFRGKVLFSF
ncbi:MAG: signal peptidase I [Leptospira sp.]|nr:signal peptidase I [Leptospira sp.]